MQEFVDRHGLSGFPHVEDDGSIFADYGLVSQPGWVFVDEDGMSETVLGALGEDALTQRLEALTGT